jgi:spore coat protein CotH
VSERGKVSSRPTSSGHRAARWRSLWLCFLSALFLGLLSPASASVAVAGEPPADDPAAWLFSQAAVVEIDLTLPQQSIYALNSDPTEYQNGTFSLTAHSQKYGPYDVGIRLKGHGSFRPLSGKAAFKVKLDHSVPGQRFLGLKGLTLNNMVQDPSMIHEVLAYEVFRSAGVAASRTGYAYVRVNDQDYGVYLNLETLDDVMLPRWYESTQHLYEGEPLSDDLPDCEAAIDVSPGNAGAFSVEEGDEDDLTDLKALIAAVNGDGDFSNRVQSVADLRQLTRMWAVEKYIGHWDGYAGPVPACNQPNNYYLHSDSADRFRMLPWGTDQTFAEHQAFGGKRVSCSTSA